MSVWGPLFAHVSPPLGHRGSACLCEYCLVLMQAAGIFLFLVFQLVWKPGAAMSLTSTWCCVGEESSSADEGLFLHDCTLSL